ncbi:hypothetical protein GQ42DRAFT_166029 [Ramicandelaber brevisporus]|nr:hypothetical protein GQ42DRAFT_166029 [Ramicandelaber brevisporus]
MRVAKTLVLPLGTALALLGHIVSGDGTATSGDIHSGNGGWLQKCPSTSTNTLWSEPVAQLSADTEQNQSSTLIASTLPHWPFDPEKVKLPFIIESNKVASIIAARDEAVCAAINQCRTVYGRPLLRYDTRLDTVGLAQTLTMAAVDAAGYYPPFTGLKSTLMDNGDTQVSASSAIRTLYATFQSAPVLAIGQLAAKANNDIPLSQLDTPSPKSPRPPFGSLLENKQMFIDPQNCKFSLEYGRIATLVSNAYQVCSTVTLLNRQANSTYTMTTLVGFNDPSWCTSLPFPTTNITGNPAPPST